MIQLKILSGKMAGNEKVARRFPFRIGRAASADLQLEEDGVWDQHVELAFDPLKGFVVTANPKALAAINGEAVQEATLRNGDELGIGAIKIRFWLSPTRQSSLRIREWSTWIAFALIAAAQLALIYWLIP
jgi:hypothetical protein